MNNKRKLNMNKKITNYMLVPTYFDSLGVKPPARDPQSFKLDLGSWFRSCDVRYATLNLSWHRTDSRSMSCSVHVVKADTALMKSS